MTRTALFAMFVVSLLALQPAAAEDAKKRSLTPHHAKAGVHCYDCHQSEKPTSAAIPDEACMVCHGDYPAMKALTKDAKPNPHDQHTDPPFACTECHHQHKPPVVKCLECHEGKFKFNIR